MSSMEYVDLDGPQRPPLIGGTRTLGNQKLRNILLPRTSKWSYTTFWVFLITLAGTAFSMPVALPTIDPQQLIVRYSPYSVKSVEAAIALLSACLVTLTYSILIDAGSRMTNTSMLPMEAIRRNISSILEWGWPDTSKLRDVDTKESDDPVDAIALLYVGRMQGDVGRVARGLLQCEAKPDQPHPTPRLWLASGSSLTTSIVQLAIWEWVFLWIGVAMISVTLLHNGFVVGPLAQDAYLRLSVVLAYTLANVFHAVYVWRACITFFTNVAAGSAWSMLNRASFSVVDTEQLQHRLSDPSQNPLPDFQMIDRSSDAFMPATYSACLEHENQKDPGAYLEGGLSATSTTSTAAPLDTQQEIKTALDSLSLVQKTERSKATVSGELALERIIASGMLILAVNISSGFLAWSNATQSDETLGSLGLLGSLSLGMASMYTSAVHLNILNSSFKEILYLKEIKINGQALNFVKKRPSPRRVIGLAQGTRMPWRVGVWDIIGALNVKDVVCLLLFGPAYFLLPTEHDRDRTSMRTEFELRMTVRGHPVVMTTSGTSRHDVDGNGNSVEAVNVLLAS